MSVPKERITPMEHTHSEGHGDTPDHVIGLERAGQQHLIAQNLLPAVATRRDWKTLRRWGFRQQGPAEDPLFSQVTFPDGWKLQACGAARWCVLVDPSGTHRAEIFYKATPYDRRAFLRVLRERPRRLRRFLGLVTSLLAATFAFVIAAGTPTAITALCLSFAPPAARDVNQWPPALYVVVFGPIVIVGLIAAFVAIVFVETAPGYTGPHLTGRRGNRHGHAFLRQPPRLSQ